MSQRIYYFGDFTIITGWDRPLQYHFLVVEQKRTSRIVYSNLDDREFPGGHMTVTDVFRKLRELKLPAPPTLEADLMDDQIQNVGNKTIVYQNWLVQ